MAVVQILAAGSAGATSALLVVLASEWLGLGPSGFGLLLAAIGAGALVGPLALRRFVRPGRRLWLFGPYGVRGLVDLSLAAVASPAVAVPALTAYGVGTSTGMVAFQSTLQHRPRARFGAVCWPCSTWRGRALGWSPSGWAAWWPTPSG